MTHKKLLHLILFHYASKYRRTQALLSTFYPEPYPYLIFTKNDLVADDKYLNIYKKNNSYFQMTITTLNEYFASKVEQNAPSPQSRIDAISKLIKEGFKTAFRINPLFPIYPDGYYSEERRYNNSLDYFTFDLVEELLRVKPHCIIVGFLRVCNAIMHDEMKDIGVDLTKYFIKNKKYYSTDEIGEYYVRIKNMCDDKGVDFSVCYDRDDNYNKFEQLWANRIDCCNAKYMTSLFSKTALDVH